MEDKDDRYRLKHLEQSNANLFGDLPVTMTVLPNEGDVNVVRFDYPKGYMGNTEWWTEKDWQSHQEYVDKLKADGEYGKPTHLIMKSKPFPLFDEVPTQPAPSTGKMIFLDPSNPAIE